MDHVAHVQIVGSEDVRFFAVLVLDQRDVRGTVGVVFDGQDRGGNVQDGRYTAKVPTGELTVRISGYQYTGPMPEVPEPAPGAPPSAPPQRPRKAITPEDMWQKPTMKITVNKGGTYDLEFKSEK